MEIIRKGINKKKDDGTDVTYYLFPEYEIHHNRIPPNTEQKWHYHKVIEETIYVLDGELELHWVIDEQFKVTKQKIGAGEIARVGTTIHTIVNKTDQETRFMVFRLLLTGNNKRHIFSKDKHEVKPDISF